MTPSTSTIIFDLDGTLIHSAPDLHAAMNDALRSVGRPSLDLPTVTSFIGNGVEMLVQRSLSETGDWSESVQIEALARFRQNYDRDMTTLTRPYAGVVPVLNALKQSGVRLGVCTNKPEPAARRICDTLNLTEYFHLIRGAVPGQPKKPDAAPLLGCIATLGGTAVSAIYVGDSGVDLETARNAGVPFRLFSGGYLNADPVGFADVRKFDEWSVEAIFGDAQVA